MVRPATSDELLERAREAAGMRNVREAIRDITLHALCSRSLTAGHVAVVARTVGEGIRSCEVAPTAPVRETRRGAWAGLEEAVGQALQAIESAARQFSEGRGSLTSAERDEALAEFADLERSLGAGWEPSQAMPAPLRARIATVSALLTRTETGEPAPPGAQEGARVAGDSLSRAASGALRALSGTLGDH